MKKPVVPIPVDDFNLILSHYEKGDPYRYALLLSYYAGLRPSELYWLTWGDIDLTEGTITVRPLKEKQRVVRLVPELTQELTCYSASQKERGIAAPHSSVLRCGDPAICCKYTRGLQKKFEQVCAEHQLSYSVLSLRRTWRVQNYRGVVNDG